MDCKVYPLSPTEDIALQKFIAENLEKGYIRQSKSPYAFPFFFIKKKNGDLQPVQDYRQLNMFTVRNTTPLPLIRELMDRLTRVHCYGSTDRSDRNGVLELKLQQDEGRDVHELSRSVQT